MIDRRAFDKLSGVLAMAREDPDVTVLAGGTADDSEGFFIRPTLLACSDPGHEIFTTEYFGPILSVFVYDDDRYDEAVDHVRVSRYALTGAIFAQDRAAIAAATEALRFEAGNFYVNDKPTGAVVGQQPFGGFACLRYQRQGRFDAEPDAVGVPTLDQGKLHPVGRHQGTRTRADTRTTAAFGLHNRFGLDQYGGTSRQPPGVLMRVRHALRTHWSPRRPWRSSRAAAARPPPPRPRRRRRPPAAAPRRARAWTRGSGGQAARLRAARPRVRLACRGRRPRRVVAAAVVAFPQWLHLWPRRPRSLRRRPLSVSLSPSNRRAPRATGRTGLLAALLSCPGSRRAPPA